MDGYEELDEQEITRRIRRLEREQRWLRRFGWIWLGFAFVLFLTRAQMPSDWWALADVACTVAPLTIGSIWSFVVVGGDIHRLELARLSRHTGLATSRRF